MRIDYGLGYLVYFLQRGRELIILLAGGDKQTQPADIAFSLHLAQEISNPKGEP